MTMIIDFSPQVSERLTAAAHDRGIDPVMLLEHLVTEYLPPVALPPVVDAKNAAAMAYLQRKLRADATDDPEELRKAEEELEELQRNLNANRAATGERLVFPQCAISCSILLH